MSHNKTHIYDVVYKGEPGSLTINDKTFHFQATNVDASVKCPWSRVEKRQLSPPGADVPMIKLIMKSGRTAVFECTTTAELLVLVRDIKARMANSAPEKEQALSQSMMDQEANLMDDTRKSAGRRREWKDDSKIYDNSDVEAGGHQRRRQQQRTSTTKSKPPVLPNQDEFLSQAHDKRDDSRRTVCYCCWESIYCWICLVISVLIIIGAALLIYFLVIKDDGNDATTKTLLCEDPTNATTCPSDYGMENLYGIRAVEYVWTPEQIRLEHYISDYILDSSISYTLYDGTECRNSDNEIVPNNNDWLRIELVDGGAPEDGGSNLYNEGRGTRQLDIVVTPREGTTLQDAPFYTDNSAAVNKAFLRFCVAFSVQYNQINDYKGSEEVNYIENALQVSIDTSGTPMIIQDVQVRTITPPEYKL